MAFRYSRHLDHQMADLQDRVEHSERTVDQIAELSRSAMAQASRAEESARVAVEGRTQAEGQKVQAVKEADQALQTAANATEEARIAREETNQIKQRREAEIDRIQKALAKIAPTDRTPIGLVMTLSNDSIKFDFDKSALRPENRELLSRIAGVLLTTYGFHIQIFGHTDDIGTDEYNQALSERRANAVRDYFVEAGVPADIMTAKGFGKSSPKVRGTAADARAKNRRVEIGFIDSVINYGGEVPQKTLQR